MQSHANVACFNMAGVTNSAVADTAGFLTRSSMNKEVIAVS